MSETTFHRYKLKRRTTAGWASNNEVLLAGEPGIEVLADGSEKIKYGDGTKTWAQLGYAAGGGAGGAPSAHKASHATGGTDALSPADIGAATAAQGTKADSAVQAVTGTAPITSSGGATPAIGISAATTSAAGSMSAADKVKLDGIANGATANSTDAQLRDRATHTGTQPATTITGLSTVATSGAYSDLSGRPDLSLKADLVNGLIPSAQLPGFVDDVLEFANLAAFPATGETGKIYIALNTNKQYRWSGSTYQEINPSPGSTDAIPEGSVNLYHTTLRAAAAAPVQSVAGKIGTVTLAKNDVGLSNVDNTSDADKPISTATATALAGKEDYYPLRQTLTAVSGTYTLNVTSGKEFTTGAAINGATIINLSNLASIPANSVWRGVLRFAYTSGAISWFTGNTGYTVKWDGGSVLTPTAGETEAVIIEVVGGSATIEIVALRGRM